MNSIVSWPILKQWNTIRICDSILIVRQKYKYSRNRQKEKKVIAEEQSSLYCIGDNLINIRPCEYIYTYVLENRYDKTLYACVDSWSLTKLMPNVSKRVIRDLVGI